MQRKIINEDLKDNKVEVYDMRASEADLKHIFYLIENNDKKIISKRSSALNGNSSPCFTLLKPSAHHFYLVGEGPPKNPTNPGVNKLGLFGLGSYGRVKAGVCYQSAGNGKFVLDEDDYAIKILNKNLSLSTELLMQSYKNAVRELNFFKLVHNSGEIITSEDLRKIYIIMIKLPGKKIYRLDFDHMNFDELRALIKSTTEELQRIHELGIGHGDTHFGNILYDTKRQKSHFVDFGKSDFISNNQDIIHNDWYKLLYTFYSTMEYVVKEDNKVIQHEELEPLITVFNHHYQTAENKCFVYADFKMELDAALVSPLLHTSVLTK